MPDWTSWLECAVMGEPMPIGRDVRPAGEPEAPMQTNGPDLSDPVTSDPTSDETAPAPDPTA
jgi:hypothetical protein